MVGSQSLVRTINYVANIIKVLKGDESSRKISESYISKGKITRLNSMTLVRPIVLISKNLEYADDSTIKNIIEFNLKLFIANLVQAFKILGDLLDVSPVISLGKLVNSNITPIKANQLRKFVSANNSFGDLVLANNSSEEELIGLGLDIKLDTKSKDDIIKLENGLIKTIDIEYTVTVKKDGESTKTLIKIPLTIFPSIHFVDTKMLLENLTSENRGASFWERWHEFRSGAISLFDLIFATDLIKKYKQRRLNSLDDIAEDIRGIKLASTISSLATGEENYYQNYNIYIFSKEEKVIADSLILGDVYKDKYKEKFLDAISAFDVNFVDLDKEQLILLIDNIPGFSVLRFKYLNKGSKGNDLEKIFKSLVENRNPF